MPSYFGKLGTGGDQKVALGSNKGKPVDEETCDEAAVNLGTTLRDPNSKPLVDNQDNKY